MENKDVLKRYILTKIDEDEIDLIQKICENFEVSTATAYNLLNRLVSEKVIIKDKSRKCKYNLSYNEYKFSFKNERIDEDIICNKYVDPYIESLNKNVYLCWRYCFTEMMNNAIEHSQAQNIDVIIRQNELFTSIYIIDDGIGIFNNIKEYYEKINGVDITLKEAASLLLAGKFTTAKSHHSGEGIFFSSRIMDEFIIYSSDVIYSLNAHNLQNNSYENNPYNKGTFVFMKLDNQSKKTARKVFDIYANPDDGFIKTNIPLNVMFSGYPVARSEARRLGLMISKFEEAELDFSGIIDIGQAFAHELFIVFKRENPNLRITIKNANKDVKNMISRVENTEKKS